MSSHTVKAVSVGALNNSHPLFFNYSEHPDLDQEKEDHTNRAFIFEFRKVVHLFKNATEKCFIYRILMMNKINVFNRLR